MFRRRVAGGEETGAFIGHIDVAPWQFRRIALCRHADALARHMQGAVFQFRIHRQAAMDGVVFQQVQQVLGIGQVVDGNDFDPVKAVLDQRAQHAASDAAKAVDGDFRGHGESSGGPVSGGLARLALT